MKKLTKILALIMAGLLVSASLFACGEDSYTDDEDEDEDKESKADFSDYEKLSPEEVFEALEDADEVELEFWHPDVDATVVVKKDGNKVRLSQAESDDSGIVSYIDLKKGISYQQDENGDYITESEDGDLWADFLEFVQETYFAEDQLDFFLSDDNYDKDGNRFNVKESVLEEYDYFGEMDVEAYMERDDAYYEFVCKVSDPDSDETASIEYSIEFKDVTVKLPKVEEEPDEKPNEVPGEKPQTKLPVATDAPIATLPPVDVPVEPDEPSVMSPNEIGYDLMYATDVTITVIVEEDGALVNYTFEKDGEKLMVRMSSLALNVDDTVYCDLDAGVRYYCENGKWYSESASVSWDDIIISVNEMAGGILSMSDDDFEYDYSIDGYQLKDSVASDMDLLSVTLLYSDVSDAYVYHILDTNYTGATVTIDFSVWNDIEFPNIEETPSQENTFLSPGQIYSALLTNEDITIVADAGSTYAKYVKDGDLLAVSSGTSAADAVTVYCDLANKIGYTQENGVWVSGPLNSTASWESLLIQMNLSASTYIFVDSYYNSFTEEDTILSIKDNLLAGGALASVEMERSGNTYTVYERYATGETSVVSFSFDAVTVTLPTV